MHILHISPYFSLEMGGVTQVVYHAARSLAARGHVVTVLASDYHIRSIRSARFEPAGFQEVLLPAISGWGFYVTPAIWTWLKKNIREYDVIHMHTLRTFQNAVTLILARKYGIPYMISTHGTLPIAHGRTLAKQVYDLLFGRTLLASASLLLAVSSQEVEQFHQAGIEANRIRLLYNGLEINEFRHLPKKGTFRKQAGFPDGKVIILYFGRLHHSKNIQHLIEAFRLLRNRLPDATLVISGPDEGDRARLENLTIKLQVNKHVLFAGPFYNRDRLSIMVDANVLINPRADEIFGLVPFEALMCGTPVIVAERCGLGELIQQAEAGYTFPAGDIPALAETIWKVIQNPEDARARIFKGQEFIRHYLDWQVVIRNLEKVYDELMR